MLGSLALAAVGGVMAVFVSADDLMFRVMWTGFVAAIAAVLMLPLSRLVDRRPWRPAGLYAMSVVLLLFLLSILLLWADWWLTGRLDEQVAITMAFLVPAGVVGTGLLRMMRSPTTALAGIVGLGISGLSFIALMVGTWMPRRSFFDEEWLATGFTLAALGAIVATGVAGHCALSRNLWRWGGVATGVAAAALILVDIWQGEVSEKVCFFFGTMAALASYSNLVLLVPLKPTQGWARVVGLITAALAMILINAIVFTDGRYELLERSAAALGIVSACAAVALIILAALNRRGNMIERDEDGVDIEINLVCPRCRHPQTLPVGETSCAACGLRFNIRVEEPRCPNCEYLLYQLTSDRCPECGWQASGDAARVTAPHPATSHSAATTKPPTSTAGPRSHPQSTRQGHP